MRSLILLVCLLASFPAPASDGPASAPTVADLEWMTGHWAATVGGVEMEEIWLAPRGGVLLGMHRDVTPKRTSFEFIRIASTAEGIFYLAQPSGRPPTPFRLTESRPGRAVFSNPEHDFPQRITYELNDGRLCATVEGPPKPDEKPESWCWERRDSDPRRPGSNGR